MNYDPVQKRLDILALLTEGKSLRTACLEVQVHVQTVMGWLRQNEEFKQAYLEAKQEGADALADSITELADQAIREPEKANAIRVAIDARKWVASKLKPKSYGDRIEQHVIDETPRSPNEVADRIKSLETELRDLMNQADEKQESQEARQEEQGQEAQEAREAVQRPSAHNTTPTPIPPLH
jgi:hypothetical protein